jgi:ribosomal protein S18 acetylase RimI-like enzyme
VVVRPYTESDRAWAERLLDADFGGRLQARRGELIDVLALSGLVAEETARPVGLLAYRCENGACEIAFIAAVERHRGIGSALLDALRREVTDCERMWLVATNDNLEALRFYQRRGFVLSALRAGAVDEARRELKPTISRVGNFGIPIRDEIELEAHISDS